MDISNKQKKKKVAIVTLQSVNYGNRLQNFALQQVLLNMGFDVESIDYYESSYFIRTFKSILKSILGKGNGILEFQRVWAFYLWNKRNIIFSKKKSRYKKNYSKKNIDYDYYIAGSDQVWHPNMAKITLLSFVKPEKRISYAASFGINCITEEQRSIYKDNLKHFKNISVREASGITIVKKLSGKDAVHVLDPTMLIDIDVWKSVEVRPSHIPSNEYILIYSLGDIPDELNEHIMDISKRYGYSLHNMLTEYYVANPFEFLYLISHSKLFVTDSFHGTVFSILYQIPFLVFKRAGRLENIFARLESLLTDFNYRNRIYNNTMTNEHILSELEPVNIELRRNASLDFLRKSLDKRGNYDDKVSNK